MSGTPKSPVGVASGVPAGADVAPVWTSQRIRVADEAAMLALTDATCKIGYVAVLDNGEVWQFAGPAGGQGTIGNWTDEIDYATQAELATKANTGTYQTVPSFVQRNGTSAVPDGIELVFTFDSTLPVNRFVVVRDYMLVTLGTEVVTLITNGTVVTATFTAGNAPLNSVSLLAHTISL